MNISEKTHEDRKNGYLIINDFTNARKTRVTRRVFIGTKIQNDRFYIDLKLVLAATA